MSPLVILEDDPRRPDVMRLLEAHLGFAREVTPPEDVHALDLHGLVDPAVTLFSARQRGELLAMGALRHLDEQHAELKSMHTAAAARRRGVGRRVLEHLIDTARARGYQRISLETGTMDAFEPARALYREHGFEECEPFGEYRRSPSSVCMTMRLR